MPIRVRYNNDPSQNCTIRPTPFMSISTAILKNGATEAFGVAYTITLTGTILADQGTPYAVKQIEPFDRFGFIESNTDTVLVEGSKIGPYNGFDAVLSASKTPPRQDVPSNAAHHSIFMKQKALRALFARDGQRLELSDWDDNSESIICYPRLIDMTFDEGIYVDTCGYTITLEADTLLNSSLQVDADGTLILNDGVARSGLLEQDLFRERPDNLDIIGSLSGAFISDFSEDWSLEVDDSLGESNVARSYRVTHSLSATGKTHYGPKDNTENEIVKRPAWEQARNFVQQKLCNSVQDLYPNSRGIIGSGVISLAKSYQGYNHVRTEQINESAGSYSASETFLLASGTAYENYSMSVSSSTSDPFINVSIDGNVKGLTPISPSGFSYGGTDPHLDDSGAYDSAINKYSQISNSGRFGLTSDIYKRANAAVAVQLNSQPNSVSLGINEILGEISYSLDFNNRPTNIISGVLTENISVNDTYPGDVFAVIPVLGRPTGPVLQYIGGRTEYKRDVQLNLLMDYTKVPYGSTRNPMLLAKPSLVEPTASQIATLIKELSPEGEVGVRKYFLSPPQENWTPKEGSYSITLNWTYELDK